MGFPRTETHDIRDGKNGERYAPLGRRVLEALRDHYRASRPAGPELFPGHRGRRPGTVLSRNAISKVLRKVVKKAGIDKPVTPHTFRHNADSRIMPSRGPRCSFLPALRLLESA